MKQFSIILENIRSLHNVGSIFRTMDAVGINNIFLCGYTGCPPDKRIEKVSLGAEKNMIWKHYKDITPLLQELKNQNTYLIAAEQSPISKNIFTLAHTPLYPIINKQTHIAIIFGNEVNGVEPSTLDACDIHLEIPMYGEKHSLNVSVATGIFLYQMQYLFGHQNNKNIRFV